MSSVSGSRDVIDYGTAYDVAHTFNNSVERVLQKKELIGAPAIFVEQDSQSATLDKLVEIHRAKEVGDNNHSNSGEPSAHELDVVEMGMYAADHEANSKRDMLTKQYDRRGFDARLGVQIAEIQRNNSDYGLAFVLYDAINFKGCNDDLGYKAGDALLVQIAQTVSREIRKSDTLARYGGDEFVAILPTDSIEVADKALFDKRSSMQPDGTVQESEGILTVVNAQLAEYITTQYEHAGKPLPERLPGQLRAIIIFVSSEEIKQSRSSEVLVEAINAKIEEQYELIKEKGR